MNHEESINKKTSEHLWKIGNILSSSCPAASRFYLFSLEQYLKKDPRYLKIGPKRPHLYCKHCGSLFTNENSSLRARSCSAINKHVKKLLKKDSEQPWSLNNRQKKKIRKFYEATSKIVYICFICKKKIIFPGDKKRNTKKYKSVSSSLPTVKIKKGDLNAGLFISTSAKIDKNVFVTDTTLVKENAAENIITKKTTVIENCTSLTQNRLADYSSLELNDNLTKCQIPPSKGNNSNKSNKKGKQPRRKTLFDEILKKEQEKKARPSLTSFLVSL